MLSTDQRLTLRYKEMFGLNNIDNTLGNTTFQGDIYVTNRFDIFGNSIVMKNVSVNSLLTVNGNSIFNSDTTINSQINISGSTLLNNNVTIGSNLSISGNTNIYNLTTISNKTMILGDISIGSSLFVAGSVRFGNNFKTNMIKSINNQDINIQGNRINFGTTNTNIYIKGTTVNLITDDLKVNDKLITLNINPETAEAFDNGFLSGIEILSNNNKIGYIKTSEDGTRYKIKAPQDDSSWYIATTDNYNNLDISGTSILNSYVTICSLLYVSGNTLLQGNTTFNSDLNISGTTLLQGNTTLLSNLNISGGTILQGYTTINSILTVGEYLYINGASTINSKLFISGNTKINGELTISSVLTINGNTLILGNITINSELNVSENTTIEGNTTILSSITISGNTNINSDTNIYGSIIVSGNTILNNNSTINSQLLVKGTANLNNNISVSSNFNIIGNIISNIPEYTDNLSAKNGGVSVWGLYRTGGVVKIRIYDDPPVITLIGNTVNTLIGNNIIEPGATATNNISVYLTQLMSGSSNLLSSEILLNTTNITINNTNTLPYGSYTALYNATDSNGNTGIKYRIYNIPLPYTLYLLTLSNINYSTLWGGTIPTYNVSNNRFNDNDAVFAINNNILSNPNSNWGMVFKFIPTLNSDALRIFINVILSPNISLTDELIFRWNRNERGHQNFITIVNNNTTLMKPGCFLSIGYNSTTKIFRVQILTLNNSIIQDMYKTINSFTAPYPVGLQITGGAVFYNGFVMSTSGFMTYDNYISYYT